MNGANLSIKDNFTIKAIALFSLATIAIYLLTQHSAHVLANSSYILLSGFILLHIFMCGGHGKQGGHENEVNEQNGGHGGHGGCCGGGHDHGKHKHKEAEPKEPQNAGGHESTHQHEYSRENSK